MFLMSLFGYSKPENTYYGYDSPNFYILEDSTENDTTKYKKYIKNKFPTYKEGDRYENQFSAPRNNSSLNLSQPSNIKLNFTPDDSLKNYEISETIGDGLYYRTPTDMTFDQFMEYKKEEQIKNYWSQIASGEEGGELGNDRLIPKIPLNPGLDRIFGGNYVDIRPAGSVTLLFGGKWNRTFNPALPIQQQRFGSFDFDQNITLNLNGTIGEKMKVIMNWNTGAQFDFQNNIKLDYTGFEHEIIQDIDAGNISMPLPTQLITAGQNLFGFKTELKFGRLYWTSVISTQRSKLEELEIENGAQNRTFEIEGADYEDNKHFFLGQYFRDRYEKAFSIPNLVSDVQISRLEVYVINTRQATQDLRNIAAFIDLGEPEPYKANFGGAAGSPARNGVNTLYDDLNNATGSRDFDQLESFLQGTLGMTNGQDYSIKNSARRLDPTRDFKFHKQLGFVSLNYKLQNNEMLAVAYEYTVNGANYKVGELPEDYSNLEEEELIFLKMIRPPSINTQLPTWDLMMKNVYSLGTSQVNEDNFKLRVVYKDDRTGIDNPSLVDESPIKDIPLIRVMGLDNINSNGDRQPDANFDFVDNGSSSVSQSTTTDYNPVTIDARSGRIFFPVLEPFGSHLESKFGGDPSLESKYVYDILYDGTKSDAILQANKNKFILTGLFQSASSNEIRLPGIQIEEGSVKVLAGGTPLQVGTDYDVNYSIGVVTIKNEGVLNSGKTIKVQYEKADLLNFRPRTLFANRWDYRISENFVIGATLLKLRENPSFNKVATGDEPLNNTMIGADINYSTESMLLTKMVDKIPLINTKEKSSISLAGEYARIIPGHSNNIEVDEDSDEGVSYIDDFEGTETTYLLGGNQAAANEWKMASTPVQFKEFTADSTEFSYGRSKLSWYTIDQNFYTASSAELEDDELENNYVRSIQEQEVFPGKDPNNINNRLYTLDLVYYPTERGQYNYEVNNIDGNGHFTDPENRWGGIMRANKYDVDFDNANVEYIEFWLMDPFAGEYNMEDDDGNPIKVENTSGGYLYFDIGNISEDVMKDNRYAFEQGLPTENVDLSSDIDLEDVESTPWGLVTKNQYLTPGFSNEANTREFQDIGLDGLSSENEQQYFSESYLNQLSDNVKAIENNDPSSDDFSYFLSDDFDERNTPIISRYKDFNNMEGNSPEGDNVRGNSTVPDKEDLNNDNTVSNSESYYEYEMSINRNLSVGNGYVVDKVEGEGVDWYQFRIPIRDPTGRTNVNNIDGFKNIQFMRAYLTGWEEPVVLRMANFQYVEARWRRVSEDLSENQIGGLPSPEQTFFNISSVNIEENSGAGTNDVGYVLPPGVERQQDLSNPNVSRRQNEQSLNLCVENLQAGDARAVFKNTGFDLINYTNLKMFIHAHSDEITETGEVTAFIRLGIDKLENYYEYEIPLKMTQLGSSGEDDIWPEENMLEVSLKELIALKQERGLNFSYDSVFSKNIGDGKIMSVKGNPDMSEVNIIMLGIRNPGEGKDVNGNIIGDAKQVCVWFNELRMNGFNEQGGWAAIGNVNTRLADFATVNMSGSHTSVGFGAVHQTLNQRARESTTSYDVNSTVLLNKFLPTKWNIQVPMYVGYDQTNIAPFYDPLQPDVELENSLQSIREEEGAEQEQEYKKLTQNITTRKSINFTNVKKNRSPKAKIQTPLDISNFSVSYSYTEQERIDVNTESDLEKRRNGSLNYGYAPKFKGITPFKKTKRFNKKYFKFIKDFNVNPIPTNFTFRAELDRFYNEEQLRTISPFEFLPTTEGIDPNYDKKINFRRQYSARWSLTKGLSLDYSANVSAAVDEKIGRIDNEDDDYDEKLDIIKKNISDFGRTTNYDQSASLNYKIPFDKFPLTDWINANTSYKSNYNWSAGPATIDENGVATADSLGNTIQNGNTKTLNGSISFEKIYNKSKYLKSINNPRPVRGRDRKVVKKTSDKLTDEKEEEEEKEKKDLKGVKFALRSLMMVRSVNFNMSLTEGTILPGYLEDIKYLGLDDGFNQPGVPFVFGVQDDNMHEELQQQGLMSESYYFNKPLSYTNGYNGSYKATVEPIKDFKVSLDATHNWNNSESFTYKDTMQYFGEVQFAELNTTNQGSFTTSYIAFNTFFERFDSDNKSAAFEKLIENRNDLRSTLNEYNTNEVTGDPDSLGYSLNSQDVLIPSFLHAYSGKSLSEFDARDGEKNIFPQIPLPNWRVAYRGLSKVKFFKRWFTSVNLNHSYSSSYRIASYNTSLEYSKAGEDRFTGDNYYNHDIEGLEDVNITTTSGEFIPYYLITNVTVQERMSPLIGFDFKTKSKMNFKVSYDKSRNLGLSLTNAQVTEVRTDRLNLSYGFAKKGMVVKIPPFIWFNKGREIIFKNEMNFRVSMSLSDNTTYQRFITDNRNEATAGTFSLRFNPTIDYDISPRLNIQLYFVRSINTPKISTSFKNTSTSFGGRIKFNLN